MITSKSYNKTIIITIAVLFLSCNKYLDKKSNTALVTPNESLSDLQALLDGPGMFKNSTPSLGELSTDEYFLTDNLYKTAESISAGSQKLYTWRYYPATVGGNDWSECYSSVYVSNLVLDNLEKIQRNPSNAEVFDNVKGSALFYRSYYFLELLWNYAKAYDKATAAKDWGIALRTTSDFNVISVRSSNQEGYNKVISDVKLSIGLLPDYALLPTRPSKTAAYGLLARCYLSMGDFQNCLLYTDSALSLNDQLMNYNGDPDIIGPIDSKAIFKKFNKEIIFYSEMNNQQFLWNTNIFSSIDTTLYDSYGDLDLRKRAYFFTNGNSYMSYKGSYALKYTNLFSGIATDELLLSRAECYIRLGNVDKGLKDINRLLSKRYETGNFIPLQISDAKEALRVLLKERQKELIMRGLRWMDIKRLNKLGENIVLSRIIQNQVYSLAPNSVIYALPIPEDIIKLTGMPQNER